MSSAAVSIWPETGSWGLVPAFHAYLWLLGFVASAFDTSLFVLKEGDATAYLLLYFDDIILMASSADLLQRIMARLHSEFAMTDLGDLHTSSASPSRARQRVCSSPSASTLWIFYSGRA